LLPPPNFSFAPYNFAVSPDGTRLAFAAVGPDGKDTLWVRALSASGAQQLNGTESAAFPFWSPDSRHIGFFAEGKLKTVDIAGGGIETLCDAPIGFGGTLNHSGTIVFAPFYTGPLYRLSRSGGVPTPVTRLARPGSGQGRHFIRVYDLGRSISARLSEGGNEGYPVWSRDGKQIAYAAVRGGIQYVEDIASDGSGPPQVLLKGPKTIPNDWSPDDRLVFMDVAKGVPHLGVYSARDHQVTEFSAAGAEGAEAQLSPDGKWIVYIDAPFNLAVRPFPGPGKRIQVSSAGRSAPLEPRRQTDLLHSIGQELDGGQLRPKDGVRRRAARPFPNTHCRHQLRLVPVRRLAGWPVPDQLLSLQFLFPSYPAHRVDRASKGTVS
jgi:Tol biopolymer transport system component